MVGIISIKLVLVLDFNAGLAQVFKSVLEKKNVFFFKKKIEFLYHFDIQISKMI